MFWVKAHESFPKALNPNLGRRWLTPVQMGWNTEQIFIHARPITTDRRCGRLFQTAVGQTSVSLFAWRRLHDFCLFPTEWWRWTLLSGQQVEHVSESSTHLLSAGSWRQRDTLWWTEWVCIPLCKSLPPSLTLSEDLWCFHVSLYLSTPLPFPCVSCVHPLLII